MSYDYDDTKPGTGRQNIHAMSEDDKPTEVMRADPQTALPAHRPAREPYVSSPMSGAATEILYKPPTFLAWLAVKSGPRTGKLYRLGGDVTSIGRDSHSEIILDDNAVSRHHAKVKVEQDADGENQFFLYDLASANGTRVNGEQIVKQMLLSNDEIEIGRTVLVFKRVGGPEEDQEAKDKKADRNRIEFGGETT